MLYIYAWRAIKLPVIKQRLFTSDLKYNFAEIIQGKQLSNSGGSNSPHYDNVDDTDLFSDKLIDEIMSSSKPSGPAQP